MGLKNVFGVVASILLKWCLKMMFITTSTKINFWTHASHFYLGDQIEWEEVEYQFGVRSLSETKRRTDIGTLVAPLDQTICYINSCKSLSLLFFQIVKRHGRSPYEHGRLRQTQHPSSLSHRSRINLGTVFYSKQKYLLDTRFKKNLSINPSPCRQIESSKGGEKRNNTLRVVIQI